MPDRHTATFDARHSELKTISLARQTHTTYANATRCLACFRPAGLCFCKSIPSIANQTHVLILQHRREASHPFNTARIVQHSLQRCQLFADHVANLSRRFDEIDLSPSVGLLYPGDDAQVLDESSRPEHLDQLVILDGTWHQAKNLVRDIPRLQTLPRYRLAPRSPGRYRIRREPNEHALSTLEATVSALQALEPDTTGLDLLLRAFDEMVDTQILRSKSNWRRNKRRRPGASNVPRCLSGDLGNIVVAYGEHPRGGTRSNGRVCKNAVPIHWVGERMVSGETFRCGIETESEFDDEFLDRLRLSIGEIREAVPIDTFRARWADFLRPRDRVVVYHPSTARLLQNVQASFVPSLILKSVKLAPKCGSDPPQSAWRGTLEDFLLSRSIETHPRGDSRASERLANAIALVHYLNAHST